MKQDNERQNGTSGSESHPLGPTPAPPHEGRILKHIVILTCHSSPSFCGAGEEFESFFTT